MTFNQWVLKTHESIPKDKRHLYSSDTLIASVCYYRCKHSMHPTCLSEQEAKAFVNAMVMQGTQEEERKDSTRVLTEKGIKHNLKRNLVDGTAVDVVLSKCAEYLNTEGKNKSDDDNSSALHGILVDSGIIQNTVADKLSRQIMQYERNPVKEKKKEIQSSRPKYVEIRRYKFFTPAEVEKVKKKSTTISYNPEINIDQEIVLRIVEEVIKIIEEVKSNRSNNNTGR